MKMKLTKMFFICTLLSVFLLLPLCALASTGISVLVNDSMIEFDVKPIITNGRTMIPFRYVANAFGADVGYSEGKNGKIVTASLDGLTIYMTIGSPDVIVEENGQKSLIKSDVAPLIIESRTLVPVRLIAETFGCSVGWRGDTKQVIIITPDKLIDKFYASGKGIYNPVFEPDFESFSGEYSIELTTKDKKLSSSLEVSENAVSCKINTSEGKTAEIITTDELIYIKDSSSANTDWSVLKISEFAKIYPITDTDGLIMNLILNIFIDSYVEQSPTDTAYARLHNMLNAVCSDDAIEFSGVDKNLTAKLDTRSLITNPQMNMSISSEISDGKLKNLEIKSLSDYMNFNLIIKRLKSTASPAIPQIR